MSFSSCAPVAIFGLPVSRTTASNAALRIHEAICDGVDVRVATVDVRLVNQSLHDPLLHRILCDLTMLLPDASPIIWESRLPGMTRVARIRAAELVHEVAAIAGREGHRVFLVGRDPGVTAEIAALLRREHPGLSIVGLAAGSCRSLDSRGEEQLFERIATAEPAILLFDLDSPCQEVWLHRNSGKIRVPAILTVSGAFDEIVSVARPVSAFATRPGVERVVRNWGKRYRSMTKHSGDFVKLALQLPVSLAVNRLQPDAARGTWDAAILTEVVRDVRVVRTPPRLRGSVSAAMVTEARRAVQANQTMVFDLSQTVRIEPDGLGALLHARRLLLSEGLWIWLSGMSNPVARLLQLSSMTDLFRIAPGALEAVEITAAAHRRESERVESGQLRQREWARSVSQPYSGRRVAAMG